MNGAMLVHDELLDHYKFPRFRGAVTHPDFSASLINHSCGDRVEVSGTVKDRLITQCVFQGEGCVLSQAAASMLMELVQGKTIDKVIALDAASLQERVGIAVGPTRLRCVLLALEALRIALKPLC